MPRGEPFVFAGRGGLVESVHAVAACAADPRGAVLLEMGDITEPVFLRSSIKPFIAATVIRSGAADRFGLDDRELALISASHNGEEEHVAGARSILAKSGIAEGALRCGAHLPYDEAAASALRARGEAPGAIHSNCSGKHAGILALCRAIGAPPDAYLEASHPAQVAIAATCGRLFGVDPAVFTYAVDGCGIPTIGVSLRAAAMGFARFAALSEMDAEDAAALARVKRAMAREPWYVGGTGRFDTALMEATGGAVVCKGGAEGVHCSALEAEGRGLALKVVDGASRAVAPAACALLNRLGALPPAAASALESFARPVLRNVAGDVVGEIFAAAPP